MTIYVPAELPATCCLQEVVFWVALGRVPEPTHRLPYGEPRDGEEARRECEPAPYDQGFSLPEFRFVDAPKDLDFERYIAARSLAVGGNFKSGKDYLDWHISNITNDWAAAGYSIDPEWLNEERQRYSAEATEVGWALRIERIFEPLIEAAQAKVFKALGSGKLIARGYVLPEEPEPDFLTDEEEMDYVPSASERSPSVTKEEGEWVVVPYYEWDGERVDWEASEVTGDEKTYYLAQVDCASMLEVFARPDCKLGDFQASTYPSCAIVEGHASQAGNVQSMARRPRGAPGLAGGEARADFLFVYGEFQRKGILLPQKEEAAVSEVQAFVARRHPGTKAPGRSTVQEWIKLLYNKPDRAAG